MDTGEEEQLYEGNVYSFTVLSDEIVLTSEGGTHSIPIRHSAIQAKHDSFTENATQSP